MAAAGHPWRPLGRLLVERGYLNEEQLDFVLREQWSTAERMGEILVRHGLITRGALADLLDDQSGLAPLSEDGFGAGLRAQLARRPTTERGDAAHAARVAAVSPGRAAAPGTPPTEAASVDGESARILAIRLAGAEEELAAVSRLHDRRRAQAVRLVQRIRNRRSSAVGRAAAAEIPPRHLLFVQLGGRYELIEREGPPPEPGAQLQLPQANRAVFVVTKVGRSPFTADPRRCAYADPSPLSVIDRPSAGEADANT